MKHLAIDYGTKRIGLAISNARGTIALPFGIFENNSALMTNLARIIKEEGIAKIVVGTPDYNKKTPFKKKIQLFITKLNSSLPLPVVPRDKLLPSGRGKKKSRHDLAAC